MTDQAGKAEADVNRIIERYSQTGLPPSGNQVPRKFGFASSKTYAQVAREMAEVNSAFAALPSAERLSHSNDPAVWLDHIAESQDEPPEKTPSEPSEEPSTPPPGEPPPEDSTPGDST